LSFNLWHSIEIGDKIPELVYCIIEIHKGSKAKYELNKKSGVLIRHSVLFSVVNNPANYGFI
jgi:inorganic pyrophosphatase